MKSKLKLTGQYRSILSYGMFLIWIISLFACSKRESKIYDNKTLDTIQAIAQDRDMSFVIVLTDSNQELSKEYLQLLKGSYSHLTESAIYNIIDINLQENIWYKKWLNPISTPLTCVFSSNGALIDLIPGATKETFLYSAQAIENMSITGFHWPNRFGGNKKKIVPLLNEVLKYKRELDIDIYRSEELNLLMDSLQYPYSVYLKLLRALKTQNTIESQKAARALIEIETAITLNLYKEEFIVAKSVLDPQFDINAEPNIRVDPSYIVLENCKINEKKPFEVVIYNDGDRPLNIEKIQISCTCLELTGQDKDIVIEGKKSYTVKFYFTPENEGKTSRDIYIASNAVNEPILHINILANTEAETKN